MFIGPKTRDVVSVSNSNPDIWSDLQQKKQLEKTMNAELRKVRQTYIENIRRIDKRIEENITLNHGMDCYTVYENNSRNSSTSSTINRGTILPK